MEFVVVFGLLALFSIIAIAASAEDPRAMPTDPRDNPQFWAVFGRR